MSVRVRVLACNLGVPIFVHWVSFAKEWRSLVSTRPKVNPMCEVQRAQMLHLQGGCMTGDGAWVIVSEAGLFGSVRTHY